jgi:cyanophycinase
MLLVNASLFLVGASNGIIILAGGGSTSSAMAQRFIKEVGKDSEIVVLAQMRQEPTRSQSTVDFLKEEGATKVTLISDVSFSDARRKEVAVILSKAKGFWMPGGDQGLFTERFGADWIGSELRKAQKRGASFFGTSAGAMLCSETMINGSLSDGIPRLSPGLSLAPGFLIDTHFSERKREPRLQSGLESLRSKKKDLVGLGLDEKAWVVIRDGKIIESTGKHHLYSPK